MSDKRVRDQGQNTATHRIWTKYRRKLLVRVLEAPIEIRVVEMRVRRAIQRFRQSSVRKRRGYSLPGYDLTKLRGQGAPIDVERRRSGGEAQSLELNLIGVQTRRDHSAHNERRIAF